MVGEVSRHGRVVQQDPEGVTPCLDTWLGPVPVPVAVQLVKHFSGRGGIGISTKGIIIKELRKGILK